MINIALVGAGLMGSQHARTITASPYASLAGVFAAASDQAKKLAEQHDTNCYESIDDILAETNIDAVLIATPTDTHRVIAEQVLAAGKHVFIEKPITRSLEDAKALAVLAQSSGLVVGVGHVARYLDEYRRIGELIAAGELGTVATATLGRRCQKPDWSPDAWHTSMSRSGGVAVDMLIHDVDLVRAWFGEPDDIYAKVVGSDKYDGIDYALATLTMENGPICHLHASWAEPSGFSQSVEVCGSRAMIDYDSRGRDEFAFAQHETSAEITALPAPAPDESDPFQRQLKDFAMAITDGTPFPGDAAWALRSLEIALAMLESSATGERINLRTEAKVN